jgi:hypothetical protein
MIDLGSGNRTEIQACPLGTPRVCPMGHNSKRRSHCSTAKRNSDTSPISSAKKSPATNDVLGGKKGRAIYPDHVIRQLNA